MSWTNSFSVNAEGAKKTFGHTRHRNMNPAFENRWFITDNYYDWGYFHNENGSYFNKTNQSLALLESDRKVEASPKQLGLLTGLTICLLIGLKLKEFNVELKKINKQKLGDDPSLFSVLIYFTICILFSPIILLILLIFGVFRAFVKYTLMYKIGDKFIDLMDGTDCVWAVEDEKATSLITALGIMKVPCLQPGNMLLKRVRKVLKEKLLADPQQFSKLFYNRKECFGYFYWERNPACSIRHHVKLLPMCNKNYLSMDMLNTLIGDYCNSPLSNPMSTWEVLVGGQPMLKDDMGYQFPILFRIHHTLGDGQALIKLLLTTLSDGNGQEFLNSELMVAKHQHTHSASNAMKTKYPSDEVHGIDRIKNILKKNLSKIVLIPISFINQGARRPDSNSLHNKTLSGKKIVTWSSDLDGELFKIVKDAKNRIPDTHFSDIIFSTISAGFQKYFKMIGSNIPSSITAVIPARYESQCNEQTPTNTRLELDLSNKFTVGLLTIPLIDSENSLKRLKYVKQYATLLRESPDFAINFWVMKFLSAVLPIPLLRPILYSAHSTTVVSNIPGPSSMTICNGLSVQDIIFWIPNRGSTGIGISILTYANRLNIGIVADTAIISNIQDLEQIMQAVLEEMHALNRMIIKS